ncbi:BatA domain-containing protein [Jejudonia soesokkakensis]|uniref:BatA domain-containing protein n=1 Tax=Jejudonia soesokkakensis TaxID=1323432 RepID=A0ABW2MT82_9FLAO
MQFKHPELLYALFLLLIPILIHLFQLRRFQKVAFTNVAFLKKVNFQTRKSSQLKKWITLLLRLVALACIIIAFAQPFTASTTALNTEKETVLYLDTSFSMQAKGSQGPLLQRAVQDIYENIKSTDNISWFTNDYARKNVSIQDFKNEVLKITYSNKQLTPSEVLLKAKQYFSKSTSADKRLIYVSDFQQKEAFPVLSEEISVNVVPLAPVVTKNIAIDTAYIVSKSTTNTQLKVVISSTGDVAQTIPVSLYNGNSLIAKTAADLSNSSQNEVFFDIENVTNFKGRLSISEANLTYDNDLFFSINPPEKIKVLSVNEAEANFLQRIFDQPEFEYTQQTNRTVNYNTIASQNFVIINELNVIPESLTTALNTFVNNGGSLCIIPPVNGNTSSYNALLNRLRVGTFSEAINQEKKITKIVFDHPLYSNVFEKRVVNFQYPKVNSFNTITSNATAVLQFEDNKPFIVNRGSVYVSTAAFNTENSNFQNSPLIVPTLYNMAQLSLPLPQLYYEVGKQNNYSVPVTLIQDEILTIKDSTQSFIPLQQTKANQVDITTNEEPATAATYSITKQEEVLQNVSYNYDRSESVLQYANPRDWEGVAVYDSVSDLFYTLSEENSMNSFWKWFAIFAFIFLLLEMLFLKFYKR